MCGNLGFALDNCSAKKILKGIGSMLGCEVDFCEYLGADDDGDDDDDDNDNDDTDED